MTQSKDMPKEIYVFPDPQSIGDRGFTTTEPEKTCEDMDYTKYIRADLTPQSPNRAVLDALERCMNNFDLLFQNKILNENDFTGLLTECHEAIATPPQSPNRAVLDDEIVTYDNFKTVTSRRMMALVELFSGFPDCQAEKRAWEHLLIYAPKTITYAATQADEEGK